MATQKILEQLLEDIVNAFDGGLVKSD